MSFYLLFRQSESAQLAGNRFDTVLFFIRHVTQLHTEPMKKPRESARALIQDSFGARLTAGERSQAVIR